MAERWEDEDRFWRSNYSSMPYGKNSDYETFRPGFRYGYEASTRYSGRAWDDIESDLARDWETYEHRGKSTWQQVKDAVHDAWHRMTSRSYAHK